MGLDGVAKRQLVLGMLLVIQSVKIYDLVQGKCADYSLFSKWFLIETSFILCLWKAQVPRLQLSLLASLGLAVLVCFFNVTTLLVMPSFIGHLRLRFMPLSATVELMGIEDEMVSDIFGSKERLLQGMQHFNRWNPSIFVDFKNDTHLQGAYTVKIRPLGAAILNSENIPLCLPTSSPMPNSHELPEMVRRPLKRLSATSQSSLPLELEGVGPWKVTVDRNDAFYREFVIEGNKKSGKVLTLLSVDRPGSYSLRTVIDGEGNSAKLDSNRRVNVHECPELRIDGLALQHGIKMCNRPTDFFPLKLWVAGDKAPFTVSLEIIYEDHRDEQILIIDGNSFSEMQKVSLRVFNSFIYQFKGVPTQTQLLVRILSVEDALGLKHTYGSWDEGDSVIVEMFPPPTVSWDLDSRPTVVKLLDGTGKAATLPVKLTGRGPFKYRIKGPEGLSKELRVEGRLVDKMRLSQPGIYSLDSVEDVLCPGIVEIPNEIRVERAIKPSVRLLGSEALESTCRGYAGLKLELDLAGEGPWIVDTVETSLNVQTGKSESRPLLLKFEENQRWQYFWRPETSGKNTLQFQHISDANYSKLPVKDIKVSQVVSQSPGVSIVNKPAVVSCLSDPESKFGPVKLGFKGNGPWILSYSLTFPDGTKQLFSHNSDKALTELRVQEFVKAPGKYVLALNSVQDAQGCRVKLEDNVLDMHLFSESPMVLFQGKADDPNQKLFRVRNDSLDSIPIISKANVWPLTVDLVSSASDGDIDSKSRRITIQSPDVKGLPLDKSGLWEIVGVSDGFCRSNRDNLRITGGIAKALVQVVPSPSIELSGNNQKVICMGPNLADIGIKVNCRGEWPVHVEYQVRHSPSKNGFSPALLGRGKATFNSPEGIIRATDSLESLIPGYYRIEITSISDSLYFDPLALEIHFTQHLLPLPVPKVTHTLATGVDYFCVGNSSQESLGPFALSFSGEGEAGNLLESFEYETLAEDGRLVGAREVTDLVEKTKSRTFDLKVEGLGKSGTYFLKITKVRTKLGCIWTSDPTEEKSPSATLARHAAIKLCVHEKPMLRLSSSLKDDLCVGDVARFEVLGESPIKLESIFEDRDGNIKKKHDTVSTGTLNVLLAEAGSFKITSACSKHCCAALPAGGMPYKVYPLPSAAISDGVNYLREGDEAVFDVSLHGTPPFSFDYQRLHPDTGSVLETVSITNVLEHEIRISVKSEGTFKISSVSDRHCRYPKRR